MSVLAKANRAGDAALGAASKVASLPVPAWVKLLVIVGAGAAAVFGSADSEAIGFVRDTLF